LHRDFGCGLGRPQCASSSNPTLSATSKRKSIFSVEYVPVRGHGPSVWGVEHRSTSSRQSLKALVSPNAGRVCPLQTAGDFQVGTSRLFLDVQRRDPEKTLKKMLPVFVRMPSEILDQHNFVAGLVVHQLIHHLFREQQAQAAGT